MSSITEKYRVGARLGTGGMADVFAATLLGAEGFSRPVALKRIRADLSADEHFAKLFVAEARIASQLNHPNIVAVLDFDRDDEGNLFLVMERVDGRDLRQIANSGPIPVDVSTYIAVEMLRGLSYAHELEERGRPLGIVHRDVSPHNVLVSWGGAVKVGDFGIAKAVAATDATKSGTIKGKVAYMSPEQARAESLDGRSDLFAVGVTLHELLTGERLFAGGTEAEVLAHMLAQPIPHPRDLNAAVPVDLDAAVLALLERDRDRRFGSARAALEALLQCSSLSPRASLSLSALLTERFSEAAGFGPVESRLARGETASKTISTPAQSPRAAMAAPTRTVHEAPVRGATQTATPTAAGEREGAGSAPAMAPRRGFRAALLAIALAGAVAAAAGVAWQMQGGTGAASDMPSAARTDESVPSMRPGMVIEDAGGPRAEGAVEADAGHRTTAAREEPASAAAESALGLDAGAPPVAAGSSSAGKGRASSSRPRRGAGRRHKKSGDAAERAAKKSQSADDRGERHDEAAARGLRDGELDLDVRE